MADDHPDAAALVRQVRAYEAWVDSVSSLRIRADEHCVRPPQGVAKRKNELQAQFPGEDVSGYRDLKPEKDGHVDLAFDRSRVRFRATTVQEDDDLRIWDGARFILSNHYDYAPDRDGYLINRDPETMVVLAPLVTLCHVPRRAAQVLVDGRPGCRRSRPVGG